MTKRTKEIKHLWELMEQVPDPEIPIINLVELGVIREIHQNEDKVTIVITPTYTGCPAKKLFEDLIREKLAENNFNNIEIVTKIHPVWTTDWMSEETKAKLLKDGISPPTVGDKEIVCPQCKSVNTKEVSKFGSVACQSFYTCNDCKEPFNYFKCL
jgi:ring-1,2-phenylacetyl-CoA epoxidase subunit PaaD